MREHVRCTNKWAQIKICSCPERNLVVRGPKSKAAASRDLWVSRRQRRRCFLQASDTIFKVWCCQCEWLLIYSEETLRRLCHCYKLLMNSVLEFDCTFIIFGLLFGSLAFHRSNIWIPFQSWLESRRSCKVQKCKNVKCSWLCEREPLLICQITRISNSLGSVYPVQCQFSPENSAWKYNKHIMRYIAP